MGRISMKPKAMKVAWNAFATIRRADDTPEGDYELERDHWYLCRAEGQIVVLRFDGIRDRKPYFVLAENEPNVLGFTQVLVFADLGTEEP